MFKHKKIIISLMTFSLMFSIFHSELVAKTKTTQQGVAYVKLDSTDEDAAILPIYVERLDDNNFEQILSQGTVIVNFYAEWCLPCLRFGPVFNQVAKEMFGALTFGKLDVDEAPNVLLNYHVNTIPTIIVYKDGEEVKRRVGGCDPDTLREFILSAM